MKVLILSAGLGTRLKPLTDTMPKALVPIGGKPLLEHTIHRLIKCGAQEIVVNVHHFADQIIEFIKKNDFGVEIKISDESNCLLDTGGGIKKAVSLFVQDDRPILIHNVDILSDADLSAFYREHMNDDAAVLVKARKTTRYLLFDRKQNLVGWQNLLTGELKSPYEQLDLSELSSWAFSGIHLISPKMISLMKDFPEKFSIIDFYLQVCHQSNIMAVNVPSLRILDVGKISSLQEAEEFLSV